MAARKAATEELTLFEKLRRDVKVPTPLVVTDEITLYCPTKKQLEASQASNSEEESNRILLGEENFDKLNSLFGDEAPHMWAEFNKIYLDHFFDIRPEPQS